MTSVSHTPTNVSQNADTTDSRTDTNGITTSQKDWILQVQKWIKTPRESLRGRFKVVLDAEVINYLVSISQKKIAPETSITSVVHEAGIDPNFTLGAARNDEELAAISNGFVTAFTKTGLVTRRSTPQRQRDKPPFSRLPPESLYHGVLQDSPSSCGLFPYKPLYNAQIVKISSLKMLLDGQRL